MIVILLRRYTFKQDHLTHWDIDNISVPFVLHWDIKDGPACRPETNYDSPFGACHSNHSKCANVTSGLDGYFCNCSEGYIGNPYIPDGCKGLYPSALLSIRMLMFFLDNGLKTRPLHPKGCTQPNMSIHEYLDSSHYMGQKKV